MLNFIRLDSNAIADSSNLQSPPWLFPFEKKTTNGIRPKVGDRLYCRKMKYISFSFNNKDPNHGIRTFLRIDRHLCLENIWAST